MPVTVALPVVSVPVLSKAKIRTSDSVSSAPPPLNRTPPLAAADRADRMAAGTEMTMAQGLAHSENVVALRLAEKVGLARVLRLARQLGITTPLESDYNMVLGGRETLLYEMARAYAVVAHGGRTVPMHGVSRIYDLGICQSLLSLSRCPREGVTIPIGESPRQLIPEREVQQMDALLRQAVLQGTGRAASVVADARGKTGTTNNGVDALFIGYSPRLRILTAIWMGNDDNRPATEASGALVAELWGQYMQKVAATTAARG